MALNYAFTWLENAYGKIQLLEFEEATDFPQKFASASAAVNVNEDGEPLVGAHFKILMPLAVQLVHGINYFFLAEETLTTHPPIRRLVVLAVNECDGKFKFVRDSVKEVLG